MGLNNVMLTFGSTGFVVGKAKDVLMLVEKGKGPWQGNVVIPVIFNFFWGIEDEDKRMVKIGFLFFFYFLFKIAFFGVKYLKQNTFMFWCMVDPLGPHLIYT